MDQALQKTEVGGFLIRPQDALAQLKEMQAVIKEVMVKDEHFGVIPGTGKPTLLKPGAELLNNMYGYRLSDLQIIQQIEQWDVPVTAHSFPLFRYITKAVLTDKDGTIIATGVGECNSYETKYRYRSSARKCPKCGKEAIIIGKKEYGGGFVCFAKKGGCNAKFKEDDPTIVSQSEGKVPNEAIYDQINTLLKMSKKRSYIDATLSATRTSGMFTQDMEDFAGLADIQDAQVVSETKKDADEPQFVLLRQLGACANIDQLVKCWSDSTFQDGLKALPENQREAVVNRKESLKSMFDKARQGAVALPIVQPETAHPTNGDDPAAADAAKLTKSLHDRLAAARNDINVTAIASEIRVAADTGKITVEQNVELQKAVGVAMKRIIEKKGAPAHA